MEILQVGIFFNYCQKHEKKGENKLLLIDSILGGFFIYFMLPRF